MREKLLLAAATILCWRVTLSTVVLEDNRYKGLVVALDPNHSPPTYEQQEVIINNVQEIMQRASEAVFEATDHRAFFSEVTIVIPRTWSVTSDRDASGRWESWKGSDIRIVQNGRYNDAPLTVPGGGCGVPGSRLEMPLNYLTDLSVQQKYGDAGKVMAAEWVKYRYGVYEEHGYPGDKVYPHAYIDLEKNETLPTGCTDQDGLQGHWKQENGDTCDVMSTGEFDAKCRYQVVDTSASYSIMYISHAEKVRYLCDKETHDPLPPTPQNKHCRGQSIWEVMLKHDDFTDGRNLPLHGATDTNPKFTLVKMTVPALYLLVDDNCGRKPDGESQCYGLEVYTKLKDTMRDVLDSGIPRVGLRKYFSSASALYKKTALIPIEELDKEDFLGFLPTPTSYENLTKSEDALVKALTEIAESDYQGEVNLLFIQMAKTEENGTDYPAVLRDGITVTGLLYGDASFNNWMPTLAQQTNGDFLFNSEYDPKDAQDTLINLAPDFNEITLLYQQVSLSESTIEINVYVDETVGISTKFSIMFSAIGGTSVIRDPDGKQLADGVVVVDDAAPGIWSITLDNANKGTAEVKVTSNPRSGVEQVEVVTWTSASNRGEVDLDTEGLAFFVSVTQGNKPVTNLQVEVTVYPAEGGSQALHVTLKDDGRGDPDVQFLDGVYSSYVTNFDSLTFTDMMFFADVSVQSATQPEREKTFASVKKTKLGALPYDPFLEEPCCGSTATGGIELSLFRHISGGASVAVINGPGFEPYDPPPSQITNVEITNVDQEGPVILAGTTLVTMTWQAPGKDFTDGIVSGYEIWYSEFKAEITSSFESCSLVEAYEDDTPIPGPHGSLQTATIRLPKKVDEMTQYYLVVVALDGLQRGPPSSLLGVTVSAGESYTTTQATTTTLSSSSPDTTSQTSSSTNTVSTKTTIKTSTPPDTSISTTVTQTSTPPDTSISTTVTQTSTPPDTSISTTMTQSSSTFDVTTPSMTQTSTSPDTSISTTMTQISTTSDVTTPPSTDTSTQKPATQSTSTGESSATETTSTYFSETTTSQQPTEPPPGFVGSTGFWVMIGGLSLVGLLIIIVPAIYCFRKRRRAGMEPSKPQMLIPQNKRKKKMGKLRLGDTSLYDNVQISDARGNDVEKGVASPSPVEGGINNHGFEVEGDTEENVQRSYNDSSDEDMITSL